ncbi:hypothetical protein PIB30_051023 [Stylosanthes scabra]|uniref:Uncharacterized protein n=1 Tax=Stylosanthes scabra TaxID=79078 RepID=A0ABU6WHR7_9FABA|nr:hypothetical protein [Stylosanthes scabra]
MRRLSSRTRRLLGKTLKYGLSLTNVKISVHVPVPHFCVRPVPLKQKVIFSNRFVALASRLELLDLENFENSRTERVDSVSGGAYRANGSAYGNIGPSGIVSDCGRSFTIGAGKNGPPGKYERWLSGASTGPVGIGYYNRPDELILAYRN